ncbi:MAG: carboxypeptidase M32 [Nanoarchaeota archaeon]
MARTLITHPIILQLLEQYKPIWSLRHLCGLANWDLQTYMPPEGIEARGEALSNAETLSQNLFLNPSFISLIDKASTEKDLNDYERGIIRLLQRSLHYYRVLPPAFIAEFIKLTSEAHAVWKNAKEKNQFSLFAPLLQKIIELSRKKAHYLGYREHPYDALLDEYEEGLTTREVEAYFNEICAPLVELLKDILHSPKYRKEHALAKDKCNPELMHKGMQKIIEYVHEGRGHLRLDTSAHPFSTSLGKGDARITTRYEEKDIAYPYGSTIHEYGHALYEIQSHDDLHYTPVCGGVSLVIHESQSRFWENFVGRSKGFIEQLLPLLRAHHSPLVSYSLDEIHHYLNLVKPSLIRTEADELTYHFHIMIRFEIEKALIEGKCEAKELPELWSKKYKEYLGVEPKTDSEGVLQDVHWSGGAIGYFPTYSLGSALSAQWKNFMQKDLGDFDALVSNQEGLRKIQRWLKEHIHQHGSAYTFRALVSRVTGEEFSPKYLLESLRTKYSTLYGLA